MTKTLIRTLVLALALLAGTLAEAQNTRTLRGKLTEDSGEPLPGAAVVIKGTTRGAVAGDDGRYTLDLPAGEVTVEASFVGYLSKTFRVGASQSVLDIVLEPDINLMEEVVVTAFATQKKVNVTGAISSVGGGDLWPRRYPTSPTP